MRVPAPAKINLHLRVGPRRSGDGFHPLLTWMTTVSLFDSLTFVRRPRSPIARQTPLGNANEWFSLSCDDPALPCDGGNLVVKAATALADALGPSGHRRDGEGSAADATDGVSAFLAKRIP